MRKLMSGSPKLALRKETLRILEEWRLRQLCLGGDPTLGCPATDAVQHSCAGSVCASCSAG